MINTLFEIVSYATSDRPLRVKTLARAGTLCKQERIQKMLGRPALKPAVLPARVLKTWTCSQLDAELRRRAIPGRSRARRKADKVALLISWA